MTLIEKYSLWIDQFFPKKRSKTFRSRLNIHFKILSPFWDKEISDIEQSEFDILCQSNNTEYLEITRFLLKAVIEWNPNIDTNNRYVRCFFHDNTFLPNIPPKDIGDTILDINSTLEEVYSFWIKNNKNTISYKNLKSIELAWKTIYPLHKQPFRLLRQSDIETFKKSCSKECFNKINTLFSRLDWLAYSMDVTNKLHFHSVYKNFYNKFQYHYLTRQELQILDKNRTCNLVDIILVLVFTGMTFSEFLELDLSWIDLKNNTITIHHRSSPYSRLRDRIIPIHSKLKPILNEWVSNGKPGLYTNSNNYYHVINLLSNYFRLISLALFQQVFLIKDFRYTFQLNLEHTSATTTQIIFLLGNKQKSVGGRVYTHPSINKLEQIINELS